MISRQLTARVIPLAVVLAMALSAGAEARITTQTVVGERVGSAAIFRIHGVVGHRVLRAVAVVDGRRVRVPVRSIRRAQHQRRPRLRVPIRTPRTATARASASKRPVLKTVATTTTTTSTTTTTTTTSAPAPSSTEQPQPAPSTAAVICDRVASPGGSDAAAGTADQPFATAQRLVDALSAGQTGCLRAGTYDGEVKISRGGASGAPITLTRYPGERATVVGRMWVQEGADFVSVVGLSLNGRNAGGLPSPLVLGNDVRFTGNDITNDNTAICFNVGALNWATVVARRTVIERNRIHNCGRLPATNRDHGIYLTNTVDAQIINNVIFDNADRAVQLYPNAQRSLVSGNIMDGNGQGVLFSGADGLAASDNVVEKNVITNAVLRANVESWYPAGNPVGTGNLVRQNCVYGGKANIDTSGGGFTASSNLFVDPLYVNRAAKDFTLSAASPCLAVIGSGANLPTATI